MIKIELINDNKKYLWELFTNKIKDSEKSKLADHLKIKIDDIIEYEGYISSKTSSQIVSNLLQCYQLINRKTLTIDDIKGTLILDFGAGVYRPLCAVAILYANGFDKAYAFEPFPLKENFPISSLIQLITRASIYPENYIFSGISKTAFLSRLKNIDIENIFEKFSLYEKNEIKNINLGGIELVNSIDLIPPSYMDFQFSNAVFEHVSDLGYYLNELKNILKPGSEGYHIVDFADHRYYDDNTLSPMEKYYDGILDEINGLTPSQMESLIIGSGWEAKKCTLKSIPDDYFEIEKRSIIDKYKNYDIKELSQHVNYYQIKKSTT